MKKILQSIINKYFTLFFLLMSISSLSAQEILTGLVQNAQIRKAYAKTLAKGGDSTIYEAVKLPFTDDFSNYTGYPSATLWSDKQGFVNNSFALYPPTIGVVTLDALDAEGKVYPHASASTFPADTLTSRLIRLDSVFNNNPRPLTIADAIYFSFYYQPGGGTYYSNGGFLQWERIGDQPESEDMLVLEFGYETGDTIFMNDFIYGDYITDTVHEAGDTILNPFIDGDFIILDNFTDSGTVIKMPMDSIFGPEAIWNEIWSTNGCSLDSWLKEDSLQYFKQVLIPINDPQYLRDNFQFRFRNYASLEDNGLTGLASNVDQWHIDYVQLNYNRTLQDSFPDDVAFVMPPKSLLKDYQSMPWNQFRQEELAEAFDNKLSNLYNDEDGANVKYTYSVTKGNTTVKNYISNNFNAYPYYHHGFHTYAPHAAPAIDFELPTDGSDSALFVVTHIFSKAGYNDVRVANDTAIFEQKFYNYYAYDDGTAENGYSILSTNSNPEASLAVRFKLNEPDTLRAIRMWFNHVKDDANEEPFTLMVWSDDGGEPGDVIYSQSSQLPSHAKEFLDFYTYFLDEPIALSGTFYVGFYQNHDVQLNIGFDRNNDGRAHFMYRTTNSWKEPYLKGTPMIRPVLGKYFEAEDVAIANCDKTEIKCSVYPNPASDELHIAVQGHTGKKSVRLYDLSGKLLIADEFSGETGTINLNRQAAGIYILYVTGDKIKETKKIIKK